MLASDSGARGKRSAHRHIGTNQLIVHGGDRIQQEVALSAIQKEAALSTIQIDTGNMTAVTKNEIHSYVKVHCH